VTRVEELADLLHRRWGWAEVDLSPLGGGMNSETWLVRHAGSTYVAKRVAPAALRDLTTGCAAATLLAEAGLATGRPVPTATGELVAVSDRTAVLEHVPGRELDGVSDEEQRLVARTLALVHAARQPDRGPTTGQFFRWLRPDSRGVRAHPWLPAAIAAVRAETDGRCFTWSLLHTDPAPEAFRHDEATGATGLIDWAGAQRGPVLYDVASAVMYLGGTARASAFLEAYRAHGPLDADELRDLDAFRRFRWAVQAAYFAGRLAARDLTGITDASENRRGLSDARKGLAALGVEIG
jgi:homoserine kinase type II